MGPPTRPAAGRRPRGSALGGRVRLVRHRAPRGPAAARNTGGPPRAPSWWPSWTPTSCPAPAGSRRCWRTWPTRRSRWPRPGSPRCPRAAAHPGWLDRYERLRSSLDLGPEPGPSVPRTRVAYVPSAALLVRRAALGAGFDEELRVAEDVDLVLRLHAAGLAGCA